MFLRSKEQSHKKTSQAFKMVLFLIAAIMLNLALGSIFCLKPADAAYWEMIYQSSESLSLENETLVEYNNQLYATFCGGTIITARVLRYDGDSWSQINQDGFGDLENGPAPCSVVFNGLLYVGTKSYSTGAEVWAWNGSTWSQVNKDGFGSINYQLISSCDELCVYGGNLYAGYMPSDNSGCRVFRYEGGTDWTLVNNNPGFGDASNQSIKSMISWNNYLWVGTENTNTGTEIWRYDGSNWQQVNADGFSHRDCRRTLTLCVYNNQLYAGTDNYCRVYRYDGGTSWSQVNTAGFGSTDNYAVQGMAVYENKLFAGTRASIDLGCQLWSYNGSTWTQENENGFGKDRNMDAKSIIVFNNRLYVGVNGPAQIWRSTDVPPYRSSFYFAEGYTGPDFQEYLCIENTNNQGATANVTYMFSDGTTKDASYNVPANSRYTVNVNNEVGAGKEVSIRVLSQTANLVAERPMYFNYQGKWTGGSDAVGAVSPAKKWYFAEGTTRDGFEEWLTVQNPGSTKAYLAFHYMVEGQGEVVSTGAVEPNSRATFKVADQVGLDKDISLFLESDQNVVAERPMYFAYQGLASHNWTGGHCVVGALSPAKEWYLAEGTTRDGFEEWLCLQNPGSSDITVNATYQLGSGQGDPINKSYTVPAQQRLTVSVNKEIGPEKDASIQLTSTGSFITEKPMYFLYHGAWDGGHDVLGARTSATNWFFAEGYTGPNFEEWLCLQNPGTTPADVTITYYPESGSPITKTWTVGANSRQTVNVNVDAGANLSISAKVESKQPIIVERPMYFNFNGWTGGHDVVGLVP
jgi:hypothetical protein